jgi:hypothetical protein
MKEASVSVGPAEDAIRRVAIRRRRRAQGSVQRAGDAAVRLRASVTEQGDAWVDRACVTEVDSDRRVRARTCRDDRAA